MIYTIAVICIVSSNCAELEEYICFGKPTDTLVPHPHECNAYFLCDGGVGYKKICPDKSFFNPNRNVCDPNYKDCISTGNQTTPEEIWPTSTQLTSSPTSDATEGITTTTTQAPLKCPVEDTNNLTFLPSRERCDEFFLCYYGKPVPFYCSLGFHFSEAHKSCAPPNEAKCVVCCIICCNFYVYQCITSFSRIDSQTRFSF